MKSRRHADGLTAREVAKVCGVNPRTIRNWVAPANPQRFKRQRKGGRYFFVPTDLLEWLRNSGKLDEAVRLEGWIGGAAAGKSVRTPKIRPSIQAYRKTLREQEREVVAAPKAAAAADEDGGSPEAPTQDPAGQPETPAAETPAAVAPAA